ncbi:MAG: 4Fe-4S binding protein, partial [Thermoanaerobaculia bacterium]|nr:4Fe-4S binding protein [Thermoanaerobaculia bacterium]
RLNRFAQGAPPSELLFRILRILVSEREAALIAQLPIRPFTAKKAAEIWKTSLAEAMRELDALAAKAMLLDCDDDGETTYVLPPPMAGFFEFSLMRIRDDIDQKELAGLFHEYLNVEEDFVRELFTRGETQLGRAFVHEPALSPDNALHVLDYERASHVIESASHIGVGICYCRHKMEHIGRDCDAPKQICLTFNGAAASLTKHGHARAIDRSEARDLLAEAWTHNLVQFGENVRERPAFICNCCGCCCEAMIAARRFAILNPVHTTNFIPALDDESCNGCGKCVAACPVEAMSMVSANDPHRPKVKKAKLDEDLCLGCGVCVRTCPRECIRLESRAERVITPLNGAHRAVVMAIERGTLQHLIFDNRALWSHRAMAALLGVILRLPPVQQLMASRQVKSRYLESLIARVEH